MPIQFVPPKRVGVSGNGAGKSLANNNKGPSLKDYEPYPLTWKQLVTRDEKVVHDPRSLLRVIVHIDIDAAYAMMEASRLHIPSTTPLAVLQWDALIAVNYAARQYGIGRMDRIGSAKEKCPELVLIHVATFTSDDEKPVYRENPDPRKHKVSLDYYRAESRKIVSIFSEYSDIVQKASVDECFLDMTSMATKMLLQRFPILQEEGIKAVNEDRGDEMVPDPEALGISLDMLDWGRPGERSDKATNLLPPPNEVNVVPPLQGDDGQENKRSFQPLTWDDVILSVASNLVYHCRDRVRNELGYTCSSGVAHNMMIAKLCSAMNKPDKQTIARRTGIDSMLRHVPFRKIKYLGGKFGSALEESTGTTTVGELAQLDYDELADMIPESSHEQVLWVWEAVHGIDFTQVTPRLATKSMVSSKNFRKPLVTENDVLGVLPLFVKDLQFRLTEGRQHTPGLWPQTIQMSYRYYSGAFSFEHKSHQMPFPKPNLADTNENVLEEHIHNPAKKLLSMIVETASVSDHMQHLDTGDVVALGNDRSRRLPGKWSVFSILLTNFAIPEKGQNTMDLFIKRGAVNSSLDERSIVISEPCSRCKAVIALTHEEVDDVDNDDDIDKKLKRKIQEHMDFHVASDLIASERKRSSSMGQKKRTQEASDTKAQARSSIKSKNKSAKYSKKNDAHSQVSLNAFFGNKKT